MFSNKSETGKDEPKYDKSMYGMWRQFWTYSLAYVLSMWKNRPLFLWLLRILLNVCNFKPTSNIQFLYFDNKYDTIYQKTVCNSFLYIYISTVWKTRKENQRIGIIKNRIVKRISEHFRFIKLLPNVNLDNVLEEISRLDIDNLVNI